MSARHLTLGRQGEDAAAALLTRLGLSVLERNWSCRAGEIDLICRDGDVLVFVEVKTRGPSSLASGEDAVDAGKRTRIARAAALYLSRTDGWGGPCRFDVVVVTPRGETLEARHVPDAFQAPAGGWQPW